VVFGTVQRIDKRIRMNVQLARVADGQTLWSDKFDEFFTNLFAVQDTISEKLANTLALRLSSEEQDRMVRRYTESTEAFRLYEMGRYSTFTAPAQALNYFEAALKEDPKYALPYVDEAFLHANLSGGGASHFAERIPLARAAAKKGLELAPDYADAHAAMAVVLHYADRDYAGADREIEAALKLNPQSARAHDRRAELLAIRGKLDEALTQEQMAAKLDPFNGEIVYNLAWLQYCLRRYDQAVATMKEFEARDPRSRNPYIYFHCAIGKGLYEDAFALMTDGTSGHFTAELARAYVDALAGRKDEARRRLQTGPANERSYERAIVYMALGDFDATFERLNRAVEEHSIWAEWFKVDPALERLRGDARFPALVKRMGLE
jgi:serine/threonine-protein kinase